MKTKIEKINFANPDSNVLEKAARLILKGEVVVCPTDTGYAFSANALDTRAVAKVFNLKGRVYSNPIHIAVHTIDEAEKYAYIDEMTFFLSKHYLPGALTLVLPKKEIIPASLVAGFNSIGIRIPDNKVILRLAEITGKPLTATSANISGKPGAYSVEEVTAQLGENLGQVAMVLDQGLLKIRDVSTIVDLTTSPPQLIRQGRISWLEVHETITMFQKSKEQKPEQ